MNNLSEMQLTTQWFGEACFLFRTKVQKMMNFVKFLFW